MNSKSRQILHLIKRSIHEIDPKADIILYGSRARGDQHPDSDWDVLVLTDYPVNLDMEQKFREKLYDLGLDTGEVFSVFAYSKEGWTTRQSVTPFYRNVMLEGMKL